MGQCYGLPQIKREEVIAAGTATKVIDDPGNGYAGLNEDLWVRVFAHLPAEDLLNRCAPVCHNWRSWVYSLSASRFSYKQDYTCRICKQQVETQLPGLGGLVTHIMKRAETLKEIDILCQYMTVKELQRLHTAVEQCKHLESLGLQLSFPTKRDFKTLPNLPASLTSLKLSVCEARDASVLRQNTQLKELDLEFTIYQRLKPQSRLAETIYTDRRTFFTEIQSLSELEVLTIRTAPFKGAPPLMFPDPQGQLQAVRELTLHGLDDLLAEWFGDKLVDYVLALKSLKTLSLSKHVLQSREHYEALTRLKEHCSLEDLHLDVTSRLPNENFVDLCKLPQLVTLCVTCCQKRSWDMQRYFGDLNLRGSRLRIVALRMDKWPLRVDLARFLAAPQLEYLELTSKSGFIWRFENVYRQLHPYRPFMLVLASDWTKSLNQLGKSFVKDVLQSVLTVSHHQHLPVGLQPEWVKADLEDASVVYCNEQWIKKAEAEQQQKRPKPSNPSSQGSELWFPQGLSHVSVNKLCHACGQNGVRR